VTAFEFRDQAERQDLGSKRLLAQTRCPSRPSQVSAHALHERREVHAGITREGVLSL
jgi:hypothetical protein